MPRWYYTAKDALTEIRKLKQIRNQYTFAIFDIEPTEGESERFEYAYTDSEDDLPNHDTDQKYRVVMLN